MPVVSFGSMKTENIVALSFLVGGIFGIATTIWIITGPVPSWWDDTPTFSNFPKSCIISDVDPEHWQVYCPQD
jgi:hypothetical protein